MAEEHAMPGDAKPNPPPTSEQKTSNAESTGLSMKQLRIEEDRLDWIENSKRSPAQRQWHDLALLTLTALFAILLFLILLFVRSHLHH